MWDFHQCLKTGRQRIKYFLLCFPFPKPPSPDGIVNSLHPVRCKCYHGTITVLRCKNERPASFTQGLPVQNKAKRDGRCFLHNRSLELSLLTHLQRISCLCALVRQQAIGKLSRQNCERQIKENHLLVLDQQSLQL